MQRIKLKKMLTFIPQCESSHLWELLEGLHTRDAAVDLEPHDGDLVLLDEARPRLALVSRLTVNKADQILQTKTCQVSNFFTYNISISVHQLQRVYKSVQIQNSLYFFYW